jgi:uracil-DNA glycosylase
VTPDERRLALEAIADEVKACTSCRLHAGRTRAVPGEGHPDTEIVFVGEGPGFNEDQQGRPFVGAAGSFLNELLRSVGWTRDDVFITNVVKCRPPGNRDPELDEIAACAPYLRRQLEVLDPALVVTLGRFSLNTFMPGARIGATHGTTRPVDPATGAVDATAYAMYHPAVAFRQAALRDTLRADMAGVPQALIDSRSRRASRDLQVVPAAERPDPAEPTEPEAAVAGDDATPTEGGPASDGREGLVEPSLGGTTAEAGVDGAASETGIGGAPTETLKLERRADGGSMPPVTMGSSPPRTEDQAGSDQLGLFG